MQLIGTDKVGFWTLDKHGSLSLQKLSDAHDIISGTTVDENHKPTSVPPLTLRTDEEKRRSQQAQIRKQLNRRYKEDWLEKSFNWIHDAGIKISTFNIGREIRKKL